MVWRWNGWGWPVDTLQHSGHRWSISNRPIRRSIKHSTIYVNWGTSEAKSLPYQPPKIVSSSKLLVLVKQLKTFHKCHRNVLVQKHHTATGLRYEKSWIMLATKSVSVEPSFQEFVRRCAGHGIHDHEGPNHWCMISHIFRSRFRLRWNFEKTEVPVLFFCFWHKRCHSRLDCSKI